MFKVGGAQAIAALAFGTQSVPKVDKLFGPGNAWVTAAKQLVANDARGAASDMPAGPSEVLVIADDAARPEFVAADLLAQAEHDPLAQAILLTPSALLANKVASEVERQAVTLSRRAILEKSLATSRCIIVRDLPAAIAVANEYAAEHLILQVREPRRWLPEIRNAGSVFLGEWSPEPMGDYCSGTNHVLPTYGYARAFSGLSVTDFMKRITVQELTAAGLGAPRSHSGHAGEPRGARCSRARCHVASRCARRTRHLEPRIMSWLSGLARTEILNLKSYDTRPGSPGSSVCTRTSCPGAPQRTKAMPGSIAIRSRNPRELIARLADLYEVTPANVVAGRGSDEMIDLLVRVFCRAGKDGDSHLPPNFWHVRRFGRDSGRADRRSAVARRGSIQCE